MFLPISKYGSQARSAARAVNEAFAGEMQIVVFPAGLVSRLHDNGEIHDLQWQKSFVAKAIEYKRDIVPVRFIGLNRPRFYKLARLRARNSESKSISSRPRCPPNYAPHAAGTIR